MSKLEGNSLEPQKNTQEAASALLVKQPLSSGDKKRLDEVEEKYSHNDTRIMIELAKWWGPLA